MKKFPRIDSLAARVLARLLRGDSITHRDFDRESSSYRLSAPIYSLRMIGWDIVSIWHTAPTYDPVGRNARFVRYSIPANSFIASDKECLDFCKKVFEWEEIRKERGGNPSPKS